MKFGIREISKKEALEVIETRKPLGEFYVKENNCYVAIDNLDGDAWTEEFETKEEALKWLGSC